MLLLAEHPHPEYDVVEYSNSYLRWAGEVNGMPCSNVSFCPIERVSLGW